MEDAVNVRAVETLQGLRAFLAEFADQAREALVAVEHESRRTLESLGHSVETARGNVDYCEDRLRAARADLADCEDDESDEDGTEPDCAAYEEVSQARAELREAESRLSELQEWQSRLRRGIREFEGPARALARLSSDEIGEARALLNRKLQELGRYLDVVSRGTAPEKNPALTLSARWNPEDIDRIHRIAVLFREAAEMRSSVWPALDSESRINLLQELELRIATLDGRQPARVLRQDLPPMTLGGYDSQLGTIVLSPAQLDSLEESLDTIFHESRHAYQVHAARTREHPDAQVWADNLANYLDPAQVGYEGYWMQPIELDAREFAAAVIEQIREETAA